MSYVPYRRMAVVGWRNVFTDGALDATSETDEGPAENAVDGLTWDWWITSGNPATLTVELGIVTACDYLAIAAHNLGSQGCSIALQGSADNAAWVDVGGPFYPGLDVPYLWRFPSQEFVFWRVVIDGNTCSLGVLQAGAALVLPEGIFVGHKPATLNRKPELMPNKSERGQFLGRSVIRTGAGVSISQDRVARDWVRTEWDALARHAETRPLFFAWRYDEYPGEVIYGWSSDGASAEQGNNGFMKVSLEIEGQVATSPEPQYLLVDEDGSYLMTDEGDDGAPLLITET